MAWNFRQFKVFYFVTRNNNIYIHTHIHFKKRSRRAASCEEAKDSAFELWHFYHHHFSTLTAGTEKPASTQDVFLQRERILSRVAYWPNASRSFDRQAPNGTDDS